MDYNISDVVMYLGVGITVGGSIIYLIKSRNKNPIQHPRDHSTVVDPPTFTSVDDEGAISLEWIYGGDRILFVWDPREGAMAVKTFKEGQVSAEGLQAAIVLQAWLQEKQHENDT